MSKNNSSKPSRQLRPQVVALQKASVQKMCQIIQRVQEQGLPIKVLGETQRFRFSSAKKDENAS